MYIRKIIVGPFQVNCYLLGCDKTRQVAVIDPGADVQEILKIIEMKKLEVKYLINTHAHVDHMAGNADFLQAIKVPFLLHPDEAPVLQVAVHTPFAEFVQAKASPLPDRDIKEGDVIEIGEEKFTVLHTPGHSPGSISLRGEGMVMAGDVLFYTSIGRTDFPGCSHRDLINSIKTKLLTLSDDTIVYPGHGPETSIGFERQNNPFIQG